LRAREHTREDSCPACRQQPVRVQDAKRPARNRARAFSAVSGHCCTCVTIASMMEDDVMVVRSEELRNSLPSVVIRRRWRSGVRGTLNIQFTIALKIILQKIIVSQAAHDALQPSTSTMDALTRSALVGSNHVSKDSHNHYFNVTPPCAAAGGSAGSEEPGSDVSHCTVGG
jgi:hypothetical protein